jgi:cytochrome c-type biogenesis protein
MLPVYLGVLAGAQASGKTEGARLRLRLAGLGFALGLGLVFVALGMGASALTQALSGYRSWFEITAGSLLAVFGAQMLGWFSLPWFERENRPLLHRVPNVGGFTGGLLFGAGFAVGWTPCVGPVLATALTYASSAAADPLIAGSLLAVYALGLATPLVLASFAASRLLVLTKKLRKYTPVMQRVTGVLMIVFGLGIAAPAVLERATPAVVTADCEGQAACETKPTNGSLEGLAEALPSGPVVLEFMSGSCTVCKKMHPVISELEKTCAPGLLLQVNVDHPSGQTLASYYGVTMVPTFLTLDHGGVEVERFVGEQTKQRLVHALSEVNGKPCSIEM